MPTATARTSCSRRMDPSLVNARLDRWADWQIRFGECTGYPKGSSLSRLFTATRDGPRGARILIRDMPSSVAQTHRAWSRLGDIFKQAIELKFCLPPRPDGTMRTDREVARALGISRDAYRNRIQRGKRMLAQQLELIQAGQVE